MQFLQFRKSHGAQSLIVMRPHLCDKGELLKNDVECFFGAAYIKRRLKRQKSRGTGTYSSYMAKLHREKRMNIYKRIKRKIALHQDKASLVFESKIFAPAFGYPM